MAVQNGHTSITGAEGFDNVYKVKLYKRSNSWNHILVYIIGNIQNDMTESTVANKRLCQYILHQLKESNIAD